MKLRTVAATIAAVSLLISTPAGAAELTPQQLASADKATVKQYTNESVSPAWRDKIDNERVVEMWATSPSMNNREIPLVVIKAAHENRPTIYLLNGGDGGEGRANWVMQTDVIDFYKEKDVNVIIPMSGKFSYYTDWASENEHLGGRQMWETFLTKELPATIEPMLKANNQRAITGMSMSATTSLLYAQHNPGFYDAVGSFSGCPGSSSPLGVLSIKLTLDRGKATPEQMWGPIGSEAWIYNDALTNAEKLRGTAVYVSNATGLAGTWDLPGLSPRLQKLDPATASATSAATIIEGGAIEAVTNACTHQLKTKLDSLGIPADFNLRNTGTHSWGYWQDDLRGSWETFARAWGI
ncbi:Surface layer protein A [Corynebacterium kutscheri]|uniref:Putative esterase n=1 Tax=Corynebacterium kutscheri TaxID=35755 RepID=A0A0F6QZ11_9CORY|nr:alpha/beta hydrolase family protein [Corynebacterium kutscheri]AKE40455.1 putative esterase [Corynebacterium kutscheri]VEH05176.1 Surface layer protein A [Corynebacterium kutscheri]VEH10848.1 Surface layer protein A [Corynebacterium kutscheri]VEH80675.1 Surface layer protein A [Corynebacterium kutscheri]